MEEPIGINRSASHQWTASTTRVTGTHYELVGSNAEFGLTNFSCF
jgi:hypothetical protein